MTDVTDIDALDTLQRTRVSVDHRIDNVIGLQQLSWSAYAQDSNTDQVVDEVRTTTGAGVRTTILRSGTMEYEQQGFGGTVQGRKLADARRPRAALHVRRRLQAQHVRHAARSPRHQSGDRRRGAQHRPDPADQIFPEERRRRSRRLHPGGNALRPRDAGARRALRPLLDGWRRDRSDLPRKPEPGAGGLRRRCGVVAHWRGHPRHRSGDDRVAVRGRIPRASLQRDQQRVHESRGRLHVAAESEPAGRDERQRRSRRAHRDRPHEPRRDGLLQLLRQLHPAGGAGRESRDAAAGVSVSEPRRR